MYNKVNRTLRQEVYVAKTGSDDTGDGSEAVDAENDRGAIFAAFTPSVYLRICTISNQSCAVHAVGSIVYIDAGTTGSNNTVSLRSGSG